MRRIFLYYHIRRSERKRILLAFGVPIFILGILAALKKPERFADSTIVKARLDSIIDFRDKQRIGFLDSITQGPSFYSDTCSMQSWLNMGLDSSSALRLQRYVSAGGRVRGAHDLHRLNVGDSLWRERVEPRILKRNSPPAFDNYWEENRRRDVELFSLNPNQVDSMMLSRTGLPPYVQERWVKYVDHGGKFEHADDLLSIYGMDTSWVERWKESLVFEEEIEELNVSPAYSLNSIDSIALCERYLFSPWDASKLMTYRKRLGGFVDANQLFESSVDSVKLKLLIELEVGSISVEKRDLNFESKSELASHPYISWQLANAIVYYREKVRPIESAEQLLGLEGLSEEEIERIAWYFK